MEYVRSIIKGVEIKRCGSNPHAYKAHIHNELSLGYIVRGSTSLSFCDEVVRFSEGDGVIIPPLITHMCSPDDINRWSYVMLYIDPAYYGDAVSFVKPLRLTGGQAEKIIDFIKRLQSEETSDALESVLIELLLEIGENRELDVSEEDGEAVRAVHDYILDHAGDTLTLESLSAISGLNKFALIRSFRRHYSTTPAAFHLQHRVAQAKKMLSEGVGIADICGKLCFYDQAHLIREFKKMYGITPASYTEQLRR